MLEDYSWEMTGYIQKYGYSASDSGMTRHETERIFQLEPEPPVMDARNDYILAAIRERNLDYFSFFLHHYERQLNRRIYDFLRSDGDFQYDPERFADLKLSCMEAMLQKLPGYDPDRGAAFTTYVHPFVEDAMLRYRMGEEAWSVSSLDTYKKIRAIAWLYNSTKNAVEEFAAKNNCDLALAEEYLKTARGIRSCQSFYMTAQDEDGEETGEDVSRDDHWDYAAILWNGIQADAVRKAFEKLDYREQMLLEKRNAVCMTCGRVSPWKGRTTFEELAVMFEGSTAGGAERAYRRAVEHLTLLLVEGGTLHAIRLKQKSKISRKKKIAAAVYEYQADCDGEWGELRFDFVNGAAEIVRLADWDTMVTNIFAKRAIEFLLSCGAEKLPKETMIAFER